MLELIVDTDSSTKGGSGRNPRPLPGTFKATRRFVDAFQEQKAKELKEKLRYRESEKKDCVREIADKIRFDSGNRRSVCISVR